MTMPSTLEKSISQLVLVLQYNSYPRKLGPGPGATWIQATKILVFLPKCHALFNYAILQNFARTSLMKSRPYAKWPIMHLRGFDCSNPIPTKTYVPKKLEDIWLIISSHQFLWKPITFMSSHSWLQLFFGEHYIMPAFGIPHPLYPSPWRARDVQYKFQLGRSQRGCCQSFFMQATC